MTCIHPAHLLIDSPVTSAHNTTTTLIPRTFRLAEYNSPREPNSTLIFRSFNSVETMPHATATVNGILVAETDSYEVVDGNIYVSTLSPSISCACTHHRCLSPNILSFHPTPSKATTSAPRKQKHIALTRETQATTPSQPTRRKSKTQRGTIQSHWTA
jgi:hypothetical protein